MGTNYYLVKDSNSEQKIHIGKSSYGWCFALHVWTDQEDPLKLYPRSWSDWVDLICEKVNTHSIHDEYGKEITLLRLLHIVAGRKHPISFDEIDWKKHYSVTEEGFHQLNQSERGPNNLLRHRVDGRHCVGNGKGTYDYIVGEFS